MPLSPAKWMIIVALALAIGTLFASGSFIPDFMAIDSCLDRGGCWDYVASVCRRDETDAQELCNRSKPALFKVDW